MAHRNRIKRRVSMADKPVKIVGVSRVDNDGVLVEYSDNSSVVYKQGQLENITPEQIVREEEDKDE
jgi:hypothetical protein